MFLLRQQPPRSCSSKNIAKTSDSIAIRQQLLDNPDCAKLHNDDMFPIISRAWLSFHLAVLESIYIQTKKPPWFRQKEFVFSLGLYGHVALIGQLCRSCACVYHFSDLVYSIYNRVHILHRVLLDPFFDVLYSEENQTKKAFSSML